MTAAILNTHHAIVGSSGMGKTVTGKVEAERLITEGRHLAIIDPTDVWYGLRSDATGTGACFGIPIFGGLHGDVQISPADGDAVARIVIEQGVSAVISLGQIHDGVDQRRFMAAFIKRLRHKPKGNFHLIVDEADEACPQVPPDDIGFALLQDMIWIAKRGRAAGFVLTAITQRPADISKAVLSQMQTIVAHRLVDPRDQTAIDAYLKAKGDRAARDQVMTSLPELPIGERWIYSPGLKLLELGRTPLPASFDSSRTPGPGEAQVEPKLLGQLNVSAIAAALTKPAIVSDPSIPTDPIAALQSGFAAGEMLTARDRRIAELESELASTKSALRSAEKRFQRLGSAVANAITSLRSVAIGQEKDRPETERSESEVSPPARRRPLGQEVAGTLPATSDTTNVRTLGRKALIALARIYPAAVSEAQWAALAGYAKTGGTWGKYKGALRTQSLIEQQDDLWRATPAGLVAAGVEGGELPALGPALVRFWAQKIPGVRRMADVLLKRWPHFTTRDALAADLGMSASGGTFGTYLGRLRSNGLLTEQGKRIRLNPELMGSL